MGKPQGNFGGVKDDSVLAERPAVSKMKAEIPAAKQGEHQVVVVRVIKGVFLKGEGEQAARHTQKIRSMSWGIDNARQQAP